jgi:tetratricopeptide (TPR) repeat protein
MNNRSRFFTGLIVLLVVLTAAVIPAFARESAAASFEDGLSLYYQKRFQDSREYFLNSLRQNPRDVMAISFYLAASHRAGKLVEAVNMLESDSIKLGDIPTTKAQVGIGYVSRGMLDQSMLQEAMTVLRDVLNKDPDLSVANTGMGMVYYYRRLMPRAKGFFMKALQSNPNDLMALELLGEILLTDEKNPRDALNFFLKIIELSPNYCDGYFFAGSAYERLGEKEKALEYFKKCMELDKLGVLKGYFAPMRMGDIYLEEQQWAKAEESYKAALLINPDNPHAKTMLKRAQSRGKEWEGEKLNPIDKKLNLDQHKPTR